MALHWCATPDLYLQKDFPHGLGLAIVIVGFAAGSIFWYLYMPIWTFAVFLATAMLDLVLYYLVPDVTICYRCLSQFRGQGSAGGSVRSVRPGHRRAVSAGEAEDRGASRGEVRGRLSRAVTSPLGTRPTPTGLPPSPSGLGLGGVRPPPWMSIAPGSSTTFAG